MVTIAVAVCAVGCAADDARTLTPFTQSDKADGLPDVLTLVDHHKIHVDEPSDLAVKDGVVFTVSDRHSTIYALDPFGDVDAKLPVHGSDLEALAVDNDGRFYIGDEQAGAVWRIAPDGSREAKFTIPGTRDGNSGIEGLTFNAQGHMFVAKEKHPARIIELTAQGEELANTKIEFANDLSALAFNPSDGQLYALSDEDHALYRLDRDLRPVTGWRLPFDHPEGLAFDGSTVYIASDSEARLYVFELGTD